MRYLSLASSPLDGHRLRRQPGRGRMASRPSSSHFIIYADQRPDKLKRLMPTKLERFDKAVRIVRGMEDPPVGDWQSADGICSSCNQGRGAEVRRQGRATSLVSTSGAHRDRSPSLPQACATDTAGRVGPQGRRRLLPRICSSSDAAGSRRPPIPTGWSKASPNSWQRPTIEKDGGVAIGTPANHRAYGLFELARPAARRNASAGNYREAQPLKSANCSMAAAGCLPII